MDSSENSAPPPLRRNRSSLRLITELSRERVALRYLHSWAELFRPQYLERNAFPADEDRVPKPSACHDTAIAAFAQLAALRIGVRRTFVTIVTRDIEYVLVEATRTMSLQSDVVGDPSDKSWLGTSSFARTDGLNDLAIDGWRKARTLRQLPIDASHYYTEGLSPYWCIYSDAKDDHTASQRAFVQRASLPRFYFSVPLRDPEGAVIGSLTMLDDKPRYGVSAEEMLFSEDLSDTIAQHLQSVIVKSQRERSEKLIQALGTFNNGGRSLRDWWVGQGSKSLERGGRRMQIDQSNAEEHGRFDQEFGIEQAHDPRTRFSSPAASATSQGSGRGPRDVGEANEQATQEMAKHGVDQSDFDPSNRSQRHATASQNEAQGKNEPPQTQKRKPSRHGFDLASELKQTYNRASNLLRECLGATGVAFMDSSAAPAFRSTFSKTGSDKQSSSPVTASTSASSDESKFLTNSDTEVSDTSSRKSRACKVMGTSIKASSSSNPRSSSLQISERDMARLIRTYPNGKVFNYTPGGGAYSSTDESTGSGGASSDSTAGKDQRTPHVNTKHSRHARMLQKVFGEARSISFFPIWDVMTEKYRSCMFVWTRANRFFDSSEDITYLSSFAHSLRAELNRLETLASDAAKATFISSVSHELRSPLHGVLAGIEFIQDTQLTPFQEEMTISVAIAGRTLLETVNHILDYSKISNLTQGQKNDRAKLAASRHGSTESKDALGTLLTNVDLARLTEEVVESSVSAFRYSQTFGQSTSDEKDPAPSKSIDTRSEKSRLSVTLNIDKRYSWTTSMTSGTMTRMITNIMGNALKYTPTGLIAVRLFAEETTARTVAEQVRAFVNLEIEDTGIGMSKEFVQNDLFRPFRQADSHAAGTGLGLSIVKEIAKEVGASLEINSEIGRGTKVVVRFPANFAKQQESQASEVDELAGSRPRFVCMIDTDTAVDERASHQAVVRSVGRTASQWLGCETLEIENLEAPADANFCAVLESDLARAEDHQPGAIKSLVANLARQQSRLLVLGRSAVSHQQEFSFEDFPLRPIYVHQPIGPRKLMRCINTAKDSTIMRGASDYALHSIGSRITPSRVIQGGDREDSDIPQAQSPETASYFDLPLRSNDKGHAPHASAPLVTPGSLMAATSAETPSKQDEAPTEDRAPDVMEQRQDVLLVEDNDINMRLLVALMKKQGLTYECSSNGLEALNKYKENPTRYSLILMDMNMPVMDGFESTIKIREHERKHKIRRSNIAALTGVTNAEARSKAMDAGVNKYLTKPIQMKELKNLIAEVNEQR